MPLIRTEFELLYNDVPQRNIVQQCVHPLGNIVFDFEQKRIANITTKHYRQRTFDVTEATVGNN